MKNVSRRLSFMKNDRIETPDYAGGSDLLRERKKGFNSSIERGNLGFESFDLVVIQRVLEIEMEPSPLYFIKKGNQGSSMFRPKNNGPRIFQGNGIPLLIEWIHPTEPAFSQTFHKPFRMSGGNVGRTTRRKNDGRNNRIFFRNGDADSRHGFLPLRSPGNRNASVEA